ncbi:MAG: hypothetical protein B7Z37_18750 [Verrucomicrobia bacterium 12-59-8]|nr:MAG: hypothetical protein B7Z37_18750 [Verrucomicrobia bacterium 12-59-8]
MITYHLEDDHFVFEAIKTLLSKHSNTKQIHLVRLATESDFRQKLSEIIEASPSWILLDSMVSWSRPVENPPAMPPEVTEAGYYESGLRCASLLREQGYLGTIVFYSVLGEDWVKERVESHQIGNPYEVLSKSEDHESLMQVLLKLQTQAALE